jgi:ornithine carbamoyltransferase
MSDLIFRFSESSAISCRSISAIVIGAETSSVDANFAHCLPAVSARAAEEAIIKHTGSRNFIGAFKNFLPYAATPAAD